MIIKLHGNAGERDPLLRLTNANDNAFCERLKQVIRCLSCWSFTRKAGENRFSEKKYGLTPVLLGVYQQLKGPGGTCHGIPVAQHLACSGPARLPESQAGEAGRFVMRRRKLLPGGAGACTELHRTEGHSGVGVQL